MKEEALAKLMKVLCKGDACSCPDHVLRRLPSCIFVLLGQLQAACFQLCDQLRERMDFAVLKLRSPALSCVALPAMTSQQLPAAQVHLHMAPDA